MTSFSEVVTDALREALLEAPEPKDIAHNLPRILREHLHRAGYAVHDRRYCVRLPKEATEPGRMMTEEDMRRVGLLPPEEPSEAVESV